MRLLLTLAFICAFSITCIAQTFKVGSKVEINYRSFWYPGRIIEIKDGLYKVSYDNYDASWDGWVTKDRLRSTGLPVTENTTTTKPSGKRVEVNISGAWYKATVLDVKGDTYLVHYDGYSSTEDAWVHRSYIRDLDAAGGATTVNCTFVPPAGNYTAASPASDGLFKKEVYDYYSRSATGIGDKPNRIGIVFTSFIRGSAYKNIVTNEPGIGATRRHNGAPVNATIYPVKVTMYVCEEYSTGVSQKQVNADFSFFISKDGEWTCSKDN